MSAFSSPVISSTCPTSAPSAPSAFQPRSMTVHATGSGASDGLPAAVPDRTLRTGRVHVRQRAHDAQLAGYVRLVEARETAMDHAGRCAVAEVSGAAEPEAG